MPFLKQTDYKTIMEAKRNGDPKAIAIIQTYLKGGTQYDLDRMVHAFYNPDPVNDAEEQMQDPINEPAVEAVEEAQQEIHEEQQPAEDAEAPVMDAPEIAIPDISAQLDEDLDGLIDEDDISDMSFEDFLEEKRKFASRMAKNPEHFKMYDPAGRADYLMRKCDAYNQSFDTRRRDIARAFGDMDNAIACYSQSISDLPDDEIELNTDTMNSAYSDIVDASKNSHSFGRVWDENDTREMVELLSAMVSKYGKANVVAALNVIRGDNEAYRDKRNGQIDSAVKHYSKQLEDLLK